MSPDVARAPNRNLALCAALTDELARAGVLHFVVCPGSRSTPLAAAIVALARERAELRVWSQIDERSAGFFALGIGKWTGAPAALVCTSGTAAANFLPAVVEASQAAVPLLVLTADRPPELRDWGAAQTIDQLRLFGAYARWFAELPPPEASPELVRHARALGARAVAVALAQPRGPVHLNLPFREPLEPVPVAADAVAALDRDPLAARGRGHRVWTRVETAPLAPDPELVQRLATALAATPRGVIAAGPLDAPDDLGHAAVQLARALGWPLLAEPTSQLRCGSHAGDELVLGAHDVFLRDERTAASLAPQRVIRLGAPLTSKSFAQWLERHAEAELWLVDPDGRFADPTHRAAEILRLAPERLCRALAGALERRADVATDLERASWRARWLAAERRTRASLTAGLAADERLLGPRAAAELCDALPPGAALFVSNSLPVRDLDAVLAPSTRRLRVLANRGASGIDGIVSSALGAAAAGASPLVLFTGDLAFLYDLGGFVAAARQRISATVVVVNNDGGGIFSQLPVAAHREAVGFDALFTTPHGLDLSHAARLFGASFARVASWEELRLALKHALGAPGLQIVEIPVDRELDTAARRRLFARAAPP